MLERMKTRSLKARPINISHSRWLAYSGAAAATALAGAASADGEIHYSGRINISFGPNQDKILRFRLDQPGDSMIFARGASSSGDFFGATGLTSGAFAGSYPVFSYAYVWRLTNLNRYVSQARFTRGGFGFGTLGTMVRGSRLSGHWRWEKPGTSYVGFVFNGGSGKQYGWARVHMNGADSKFSFTVVDYAWADPGEPIKVGQTSSSENNVPAEGSVGLLALGAAGLALWRQRRQRSAA